MSDELDRTDDFSYYINAYAAAFDPHTQYFPPQQQEAFEIEMTGQLEGIGAQLQQDGEFVTIASIVTGSACWRQGELEVGDKLLKVAQGDAQPEDVVGMRVNKVVTKVRGKKGTEVRLTVRKKDGTEKVIPIVRDIVDHRITFWNRSAERLYGWTAERMARATLRAASGGSMRMTWKLSTKPAERRASSPSISCWV